MRHADFIVAMESRWLLHPNRDDLASLWPVYQSFSKSVRVNNSSDSSWQDTIWYSGEPPLCTHSRPKPARPNPGCPPLALKTESPPPRRPRSGSSQSCHGRPPPAGSGRWCGVAAETSAGRDNRLSVRTAGADRGPSPAIVRRAIHMQMRSAGGGTAGASSSRWRAFAPPMQICWVWNFC